MFEINLDQYNEMLRYERDMDELRALALWITRYDQKLSIPSLPKPRQYAFDLIQHYSQKFAGDLHRHARISPESIDLFHSSLFSIKLLLGITPQDLETASQQQLYRNSGFWEMRRFIGQFGDVAEAAEQHGVTDIISAATSGCIIAEYLGLLMAELTRHPVPVNHMVFSRSGPLPIEGHLPERFCLSGNHILIVDDALMETRTATVMVKKLREIDPEVVISILAVDIDPDTKYSQFMDQFAHVYLFDE
ncbi:MAG: phosphoribosyltransferase [Anaerolineaceae bacterium]|nr:phosphoribosyltransferase [Anaerolineaceae bacterium]